MTRLRRPGPCVSFGLEVDRPQRGVADVLERHGHHLARAVDRDVAEELQPEAGRQILAALPARRFLERDARPERVVERARPPRPGVDRTADEFPERLEVLELRAIWIIIMGGGVMHVSRDSERGVGAGAPD